MINLNADFELVYEYPVYSVNTGSGEGTSCAGTWAVSKKLSMNPSFYVHAEYQSIYNLESNPHTLVTYCQFNPYKKL